VNDREVVLAALAVCVGAGLAVPIPMWVVGALVALALVSRRPWTVILVVAVLASALAARAEAGLSTTPRRAAGVAVVASDPERRPGGWVVDLRVDGRRFRAYVSGEVAEPFDGAAVGERFAVDGRVGPLSGPWEWRASRHLSGRLRLRSARRIDSGAWWWRSANWIHRAAGDGVRRFGPDERAVFLGIVLGDDRDLSEVERFRFRSSGLSHLTAVSGQNVAFVLVAVSPLLSRLRLGPRWVVTLLVLGWFALVTRLEPSVLRAVAMAAVAATASWRGRFTTGVRVVAVAVTGVVLVDPLLVWSTGFRLSVAACVAIVTLARPLSRMMPGPRLLGEAVGVSIAAQVGTAPLLLGLGGSVPALGLASNLVAVPVAGWLMVWGISTGPLAGLVGEPVASLLGWPSQWMVRWLSWVAEVGSGPGLPRFGWLGVVGLSVAVLTVVVRERIEIPWLRRPLAALVVLGLVVLPIDVLHGAPTGEWSARGLRLITSDSASVMVIDGAASERDALDLLLLGRRDRLDAVVVTGGGRTASAIVWDLRQVVEVGTVFADDPSMIRDAEPMPEG
jgi:competence protein ComEC